MPRSTAVHGRVGLRSAKPECRVVSLRPRKRQQDRRQRNAYRDVSLTLERGHAQRAARTDAGRQDLADAADGRARPAERRARPGRRHGRDRRACAQPLGGDGLSAVHQLPDAHRLREHRLAAARRRASRRERDRRARSGRRRGSCSSSPCSTARRSSCRAASSSAPPSPAPWSSAPALVLLDEPLANLDYKLREELREELPTIFEASGAMFVYATTEPHEALLLGGNTATSVRGPRHQFGPTPRSTGSPARPRHGTGLLRPAAEHVVPIENARAAASGCRPGRACRPAGRSPDCVTAPTSLGFRAQPPLISSRPAGRDPRSRPRLRRRDHGLGELRPRRHAGDRAGWRWRQACTSSRLAAESIDLSSIPRRLFVFDAGGRARPPPARAMAAEEATMAAIDLEGLAHSYRRIPTRPSDYALKRDRSRLAAGRRLRAARPLRLRQDHAPQHHLGPGHAERGPGAVRRPRRHGAADRSGATSRRCSSSRSSTTP